jgi:hypothetical protein
MSTSIRRALIVGQASGDYARRAITPSAKSRPERSTGWRELTLWSNAMRQMDQALSVDLRDRQGLR